MTALAIGANDFTWTISNGTCPPSVDVVTITVDANATISDAGPDQTQCETTTTATLAANTPVVGTGAWTVIAGTATVTTPTDPNSGVTGLSAGVNTFEWAITNGSCPPSTDQITITLDAAPTVSAAGPDQSVCETPGTATLAGNTPLVGTGIWTLTAGTGTITTPADPASGLTALAIGANDFTWTISNGTCPPSVDVVTITVDANATISDAGPDQTQCETTTTATLAANTPVVGTGAWTVIAGTATVTTPTDPNSGVTGLSAGVNTFEWAITNGSCPPSTDQITITLDAAPTVSAAGPDQSVCETPGTATLAGNTPLVGTGIWTLTAGTGTITTPADPASGLTALAIGANDFTWTISNGTCPPSADVVTITVDANATISAAGPDQTQCETTTTATLAANTPVVGTGAWTVIAGTATVTTPTDPNSGVTGLSAGVNTFEWAITNGSCPPSTDQITITLDAAPTVSAAGPDQSVCETPGTATLAGNVPAVGTGVWTLTAGTGTITTPADPASGLTALAIGANDFTWTISNGTCPPSVDVVTINVDENATISDAGPDQTQCETTTTATLAANTPVVGTGVWTVIAGTGVVTTPTDPNSGVTGLSSGVNTFEWVITNGTCPPSTDQITITLDAAPTVSAAGPDQSVCETPGTATLAGNVPAVGTGVWTLTAGTGTITTPADPASGLTALAIGANDFTWTISNGTCPPSVDVVTINVDENATISDAGPDQTQCETTTTATLAANTPVVGTGVWTVIAGTGVVTTPTDPNSGVTGLSSGVNTFEWVITNGTCPPSADQITITLDLSPTIADAGPDEALCLTNTALAGNSPVVGTGLWTLVSGTGTITDPTDQHTTVTSLGVGPNVFEWSITNGTCPPSADQVTITVLVDTDFDLICDIDDEDDDNDGIPDIDEFVGDSDLDGTPDSLDLDSDNDGIPDIIEAGGIDTDGDGEIDYPTAGDPTSMNDTDGDGMDDSVDTDDGGTPLPLTDTDGDGVNDMTDLDSDNDGTPDAIEAGGSDVDGDGYLDGFVDVDTDGFNDVADANDNTIPGIADGGTPLPNLDTDNDGLKNMHDLDSDNDGIADVIENGGADADGDGLLDSYSDVDGDGYSDVADSDDNTVMGPNDGGTPLPNSDFDMDGFLNAQDVDSDNDGITDATEAGGLDVDGDGILDGFADIDGDGFSDLVDTDDNTLVGAGDGGTSLEVPNSDASQGDDYLDIDSDNDGIQDNVEAQLSAVYFVPTGLDSDNDGLDDEYDPDNTANILVPIDTDLDGIPDMHDLDSDLDGVSDIIEGHDLNGNGTIDGSESGPLSSDTDGDGLDDGFDTVILSAATAGTNAANGSIDPLLDGIFADADNPGTGDLDWREVDHDGDGILDFVDLDDDNDGIPDTVEDLDLDMDGNPYTNLTQSDSDGIADIWDIDSDNDGIADIIEAAGIDTNSDGLVDDINVDSTLTNDTDNDGLDDFYDSDNGGIDILNPDTDLDGKRNFQDEDSDNDGIYDVVEDGGTDLDNDGEIDSWGDHDGDLIPDYADADFTTGLDDDNDGIDDSVDGDFVGGGDIDGDGIEDASDEDANGDGWDDNLFTLGDEDTDSQGIPDYLDLDSDNDGTPDIIEDGGVDDNDDGVIDDFIDIDGDGADDDDMTDGILDTDGDGVPNHEDLDSDNDRMTDTYETAKPDVDQDGIIDDFTDLNGDGWHDDEVTDLADFDNDGIPDYIDFDTDGDGIPDVIEAGGDDVDGDGMIDDFTDTDGNGLDDGGAVTPVDTDGDGVLDIMDGDSDNDGVPDWQENDTDSDGQGPDDTDGDGILDYVDLDDDEDGTLTADELDEDGDMVYDDCNDDGLPDYLDPSPCQLEIPEGFSPNDDGVNDFFVINGILAYPEASMTIFNRWGNKVYETTNGYANDWDGNNQFGMTTSSRELPVGTYFYVLDPGDGTGVIKGYVYLNK